MTFSPIFGWSAKKKEKKAITKKQPNRENIAKSSLGKIKLFGARAVKKDYQRKTKWKTTHPTPPLEVLRKRECLGK